MEQSDEYDQRVFTTEAVCFDAEEKAKKYIKRSKN